MLSVNPVEAQVEINQKQTTNGGDSRSKYPRLDSGNGSAEQDDETIGTQCSSSETEVSGYGETNHLQNYFCSRSASNNRIEQENMSDKSSSSNCLCSLSGSQQSGKINEGQNHVDVPPSQDHVDMPLSQDHGENSLQPVISLCGNGSSKNEKGKLSTHLTGTLESAAGGINSRQNIPENNHKNINLSVEVNESVHRLAHHMQPKASSELQNKLCEDREISAAGLHHDNITRCLSAPTSSAKMSYHPSEFLSLPVSPMDLVPKHVMDNLVRELRWERCHVKMLQNENYQLRLRITELQGRCQAIVLNNNENINIWAQQLKLREQNISFLKTSEDTWKRKFNEKVKENESQRQSASENLQALSKRCRQLEDQICILNKGLDAEESKNKTLNDRVCFLERTLNKERGRFERDDKCLREKIKELQETNNYLKEGLEEHKNCPRVVKEFEQLPLIELGVTQSDQTRPKCVYPENTVSHPQNTFPKEKMKKSSDYKTHNTSPKLECSNSATQITTLTDVCSHCYKELCQFNSYDEFLEHVGKCEP